MLRGLTTVSFFADDVAAAADWKSQEDEAKIADHLRALGYLE